MNKEGGGRRRNYRLFHKSQKSNFLTYKNAKSDLLVGDNESVTNMSVSSRKSLVVRNELLSGVIFTVDLIVPLYIG